MPHSRPRTDEELVADYLDGDSGSFRALIERHHDAMIRFLNRFMGDRQAAEDVFQETFLQVHQSIETFDSTKRFKPWLFTIAANKARDALRKSNRRSTVSLSAPVGGGDDGTTFVDLMSIDLPAASSRMESEEQSAMVQRAIATLSPRLREILLLAYFQKLSYTQLADALEVPVGTVKSRLHAAVASFAKAWQSQIEDKKSGKQPGSSAGGLAAAGGEK